MVRTTYSLDFERPWRLEEKNKDQSLYSQEDNNANSILYFLVNKQTIYALDPKIFYPFSILVHTCMYICSCFVLRTLGSVDISSFVASSDRWVPWYNKVHSWRVWTPVIRYIHHIPLLLRCYNNKRLKFLQNKKMNMYYNSAWDWTDHDFKFVALDLYGRQCHYATSMFSNLVNVSGSAFRKVQCKKPILYLQ